MNLGKSYFRLAASKLEGYVNQCCEKPIQAMGLNPTFFISTAKAQR